MLTVTSYPNRTSPVLRGKWLLENILGTPPPPPPPDVPALSDKGDGRPAPVGARTSRGSIAGIRRAPPATRRWIRWASRSRTSTRSGRWRTRDEGKRRSTRPGRCPTGRRSRASTDSAALLTGRQDQFVGTVAERLLTYALGRGLEYYDRPTLRRIVRDAARDGYRWSSLVIGIVKSTPFQMRRAES